MSKSVLVVGTSRSGTSIASGILKMLGVGWTCIDKKEPDNPNGCFENNKFNKLNQQIVNYKKVNNEISIRIQNSITKFLSEIRESNDKIWGWKASPDTLEYFLPYLKNPHLIFTFRNVLHSAHSGIAHFKIRYGTNLTIDKSLSIYNEAQNKVIKIIEDFPEIPKLYTSQEDMCKDPIKEANRMVNFLDEESISLTEEKEQEIKQFIIPGYSTWTA